MAGQTPTTIFNTLYDSTNRKVLGYITARCGSLADIGDIFQETYLELFQVISRRGPDYVKNGEALVMKLARQKLFRYYTLRQRLSLLVPVFSDRDSGGEESAAGELLVPELSIEDQVADAAIMEELLEILSRKPADVQRIFRLYYTLDMTIAEIAGLLSVRESTIKNKLYRTLRELRKLYLEGDDS